MKIYENGNSWVVTLSSALQAIGLDVGDDVDAAHYGDVIVIGPAEEYDTDDLRDRAQAAYHHD